MAEARDGEGAFMPWCYGGAVSGFDACYCSAADVDLAELVRRRGYLRRELQHVEDRISVGEAARQIKAMLRKVSKSA